ncbi:hypothetical protein BGZ93_003315 [Podila epicladia]|nr:hypothetical protein BGZ93_003315 [Podila epicladia]
MNYTGAISHINLSSSDMTKGRLFFQFLLVDLMGYKEIPKEPYVIFISPGNKTTPHHKTNPGLHHLAFSSGTHEEIDEFHKKIVIFNESHVDHVICISPGNQTTPHHKTNPGLHHLAFSVGTHDEIDEFHKKIVSFYESHPGSGHILDIPALYPEYGPHYYAVFFTDPDGIKLELAFSEGH